MKTEWVHILNTLQIALGLLDGDAAITRSHLKRRFSLSHSNKSPDSTHQILKVQPKAITETLGGETRLGHPRPPPSHSTLIKAPLPNKMNHVSLFPKPQHYRESQSSIVCSLDLHLTTLANNGSDFQTTLAEVRA